MISRGKSYMFLFKPAEPFYLYYMEGFDENIITTYLLYCYLKLLFNLCHVYLCLL